MFTSQQIPVIRRYGIFHLTQKARRLQLNRAPGLPWALQVRPAELVKVIASAFHEINGSLLKVGWIREIWEHLENFQGNSRVW